MTIRIVIADDHPMFRYGLRFILGAEPDLEVVGEASDGEEAVRQAATLRPDIMLMDINMPRMNGIDATRMVVVNAPETAILILTMFDDDESVFAAMRAGARGYLLKGADGVETVRAVRAVASGEAVFGPGIARRMARYFSEGRSGGAGAAQPPFPDLTDREREILDLVARGLSNAAIADRLYLSQKTVRNYVSTILGKLRAESRAGAVAIARNAGLGEDSSS